MKLYLVQTIIDDNSGSSTTTKSFKDKNEAEAYYKKEIVNNLEFDEECEDEGLNEVTEEFHSYNGDMKFIKGTEDYDLNAVEMYELEIE